MFMHFKEQYISCRCFGDTFSIETSMTSIRRGFRYLHRLNPQSVIRE